MSQQVLDINLAKKKKNPRKAKKTRQHLFSFQLNNSLPFDELFFKKPLNWRISFRQKKTSFENLSIVCMSIQESGIHAALPTCTQRLRRRRSLSTQSSLCRTGNKHMGPKEEEKESSNRSRISAATKFFLMLISNKTTTSIATYKNSSTPQRATHTEALKEDICAHVAMIDNFDKAPKTCHYLT